MHSYTVNPSSKRHVSLGNCRINTKVNIAFRPVEDQTER